MEEIFIVVENVTEKDLSKVLEDFTNLYSGNDFVEGIRMYRKKENSNSFVIKFTNQPDFEEFCYLVNYIKYPEGFGRFTPFLRGYINSDFGNDKYKPSAGGWKMVYVSKNDRDYDNINFVTDKNESYLFDFGGKTRRLEYSEVSFQLTSIDSDNYSLVQSISPNKTNEKDKPIKKKRKQKVKDIFLMFGCLGFTCIGIFLKMNGVEDTWGGIILFGFGFIFMLFRFIYPEKFEKPLLGNKNNVE